jgi:hypothetical protein
MMRRFFRWTVNLIPERSGGTVEQVCFFTQRPILHKDLTARTTQERFFK